MNGLARIVIAAISCSVLAGAAAYMYLAWRSERPPQHFGLIADLPLNGKCVISSETQTERALHDEIAAEVQQRLLAAYRTLAYANSGKWSLATWAQLQWVRDTLDGVSLEEIGEKRAKDAKLRDMSFARLLCELGRTASPDGKEGIVEAMRDGNAIVAELSAATPNTEKPTDILKHVVAEIESSRALRPFTSGFPKFSDLPLPSKND